jgi:hypothetical protein
MSRTATNRLSDLHNVLVYCSEIQAQGRPGIFTTGERICINQERGGIFSQMSFDGGEVREYEVPPDIEVKIQATSKKAT